MIIGKLIPAATGLKRYRTIEIEPAEPLPRGIDDVGLLEGDDLAAELGPRRRRGPAGLRPGLRHRRARGDRVRLREHHRRRLRRPRRPRRRRPGRHRRRQAQQVERWITGAAAAAAALGAWSLWIEPRRLVVAARAARRCPRWPAALDGLRVGVLTDLHAGMPHAGLDAVERAADALDGRAARPRLPARRLHRPAGAVRAAGRRRGAGRAAGAAGGAPRGVVRRARQPRLVRGRAPDRRRARGVGGPVLEDSAAPAGERPVGRGGGRLPGPRRARRPRAHAGAGGRAGAAALPRPRRVPVRPRARRADARPATRTAARSGSRCCGGRSSPRTTASATSTATSSRTAATSTSPRASARAGCPVRLLRPPEVVILTLRAPS